MTKTKDELLKEQEQMLQVVRKMDKNLIDAIHRLEWLLEHDRQKKAEEKKAEE